MNEEKKRRKYGYLPIEFKKNEINAVMYRLNANSLPWWKIYTKWNLSRWRFVYIFLAVPYEVSYYDEAHWYLWTDLENKTKDLSNYEEFNEYITKKNIKEEKLYLDTVSK